jgi:cytosine/adenosine deaminase-related metal-dependent hydrolase
MEGGLVLKDCAVLRSDGRLRAGLAIRIEGATITQVAPDEEVPVRPGDWEVRCAGRAVGPGWMDCHAHLVNGQLGARTRELLLRPTRARLALEQAWDERLTAAEVEVLAAFAIARSLRRGVTFAVEHLHCPNAPGPAREAFTRAAQRLGLRALVSHATRDGAGSGDALAQAEANAALVERQAEDPTVRGAMGFHASFTCADPLLARIGALREATGAPLVFEAAGSELDLTETFQRHGQRVVPRLERLGLVGPWAVAALARAVDREEADRLYRAHVLVALSPGRELFEEPGATGFDAVVGRENRLGLGTSGGGPLTEEATCAAVGLLRLARGGRLIDPDGVLLQMLFAGPAELTTRLFGHPSGLLEEGALADLVVYDWVPPALAAPIPDLVAQLSQAPVSWTIVGGRVAVREGRLLGHDELELGREAARVLAAHAGSA